MTDGLDLLLRVAVGLGSVLGLMWLAGRGWRRTAAGRAASAGTMHLLGRQSLGQRSHVAVVRVGERALVLGVGEQRVELLANLPVDEVAPAAVPGPVVPGSVRRSPVVVPPAVATGEVATGPAPAVGTAASAAQPAGALAGSALSPATWRQAVDVLRERTVRR